MTASVSRSNMEYQCPSHIWLAAAALLVVFSQCADAGRRPFSPSESILELIDTEQVERVLAARRSTGQSAPSFQRNELGDGSAESLIASASEPESTELPSNIDFRKVLKSSKNALVVTKKSYLKEDWCKTETLVQKIREPGCISATVLNKFCYGQCNSFYIPRGPRRRDNGDERPSPAFKSCSFCRPKKMVWMTVTLQCPGQDPPYKRKRIQKIKQCKCQPVGVN